MSPRFGKTQVMLAHAFAAYPGSENSVIFPDHKQRVTHEIQEALDEWPVLLQDGWELVWGPVTVNVWPFSLFDINLMYVVRCKTAPHRLVVSIRGTNPFSFANWVLEDFLVFKQKPWLFAPGENSPKISLSTFIGLHALNSRTDKYRFGLTNESASAQELTLSQMITHLVSESPDEVEITVTGHSLGGALAPTIALWLADTQSSWDRDNKATIDVYAFAGPSPGNASFSEHFDEMFPGDRFNGIVNHNDVVGKAWELDDTVNIPNIYPDMRADILSRAFFRMLTLPLSENEYRYLRRSTDSYTGELVPELDEFWLQAVYQHTLSYLIQFEIVPPDFELERLKKIPTRKRLQEVFAVCRKEFLKKAH